MKKCHLFRFRVRRVVAALAVVFAAVLVISQSATAASWNGIEPLKSRRVDVERILGKPIKDQPGSSGVLRFKVAGGTVTIAFVDARFVAAKKLSPELEGTVRQIVLQHDSASDTPESLGLPKKSDFTREEGQGVTKYTNLKEGLVYTFINGRLRTTYFTPSTVQWSSAQR
ncbi:MAG TPA: hypothetical protein VD966_08080 [Pyrinomonadaceae bacterium]|nr:hypothetical protein [Pyrinomonadaceae bacterium]